MLKAKAPRLHWEDEISSLMRLTTIKDMVNGFPLAGTLVPAVSRGLVSAKASRIGGAGMASLALVRGLLLSPSRDHARAALQCPTSSSSSPPGHQQALLL